MEDIEYLSTILRVARSLGHGRAGSGFMTAPELAKVARMRLTTVRAVTKDAEHFAILEPWQARALGSSARAIVIGLPEWPRDATSLASFRARSMRTILDHV